MPGLRARSPDGVPPREAGGRPGPTPTHEELHVQPEAHEPEAEGRDDHRALADRHRAGPDRGLAIGRPTAQSSGADGLPTNLALELLGRRPDIVAARLRTEAAASHIDQQKAGFYPSINLMAFTGLQSLGINNLTNQKPDLSTNYPVSPVGRYIYLGAKAKFGGSK